MTDEIWYRNIDMTVTHAIRMTRAVIPALIAYGGGSIRYISSVSAQFAAPRQTAYPAGKAALQSLARTVAIEHGPAVRANTVSPGAVGTPRLLGNYSDDDLQAMRDSVPLRRLAEPADIAVAVKFLSSDDAAFISGVDLPVDGGAAAQFPATRKPTARSSPNETSGVMLLGNERR